MCIQETFEQDFFIYVPAMQELVRPVHTTSAEYGEASADLPPGEEDWVRISLTGQVVVYARLRGEEKAAYN
ncbi:MAG: hypothetical protein JOZ18_19150 [Chloroflexi bacterium]|nr:hypothetical protein [Chloroflexota bacterium]